MERLGNWNWHKLRHRRPCRAVSMALIGRTAMYKRPVSESSSEHLMRGFYFRKISKGL